MQRPAAGEEQSSDRDKRQGQGDKRQGQGDKRQGQGLASHKVRLIYVQYTSMKRIIYDQYTSMNIRL
jgi:hypothetical protein